MLWIMHLFSSILLSHQSKILQNGLYPHQPTHLPPTPDTSMDYFQCLDVSLAHHPHRKVLLLNELSLDSARCEDHNPCITCILTVLYTSPSKNLNPIPTSNMILDPIFPLNNPVLTINVMIFWAGALVSLEKNHFHVVACPSHYRFRTAHIQYYPTTDPPQ